MFLIMVYNFAVTFVQTNHTIVDERHQRNNSDGFGIPAIMRHRQESCAALCPTENLNRALLIHNSKTMAAVMFQGPSFLKVGGLVGPPFHNFRSITEQLFQGHLSDPELL